MSDNLFESLNEVSRKTTLHKNWWSRQCEFNHNYWKNHFKNKLEEANDTLGYKFCDRTLVGMLMFSQNYDSDPRVLDMQMLIRIEALEKRNAELEEKCSGPQLITEILNRLDNLERKNANLETINGILNEKLNSTNTKLNVLEESSEKLEMSIVGGRWEDTIIILKQQLQVQIDSIRKGLSVHYSRDSDTEKRIQEIEEKISANKELITEVGLLASNSGNQLVQVIEDVEELKNQPKQSPVDDEHEPNPETEEKQYEDAQDELMLFATQDVSDTETELSDWDEDDYVHTAIGLSIETFQKEQTKPKSCLLNYCTQCKKRERYEKGFKIKGNYFCTSICSKEYQKEKSPIKGNFTSVMNPAIYN
jgi:hypothetical protein